MCNIAQESLLAVNEAGKPMRHSADGFAQPPQFVFPLQLQSNVELSVSDLAGGGSQSRDSMG